MPDTKWLHSLYQQAPVAIGIYVGPRQVVEFANPKMCQLWGRAAGEVLGKPLFEALPELRGQGLEEWLAEVLQTGVSSSQEEQPARLLRNGALELCYFDVLCEPLRDDSGSTIGVIQVATEVTRQVKGRRRSEQNEEFLRKALSAARMGSWQVDVVASTFNRSGEFDAIVFGQPEAGVDWQPERLLACVHPDDQAAVEAQVQQHIGQGQLDLQVRVQWPDGSLRWVHVQGETTFGMGGQPVRILGIVQDITCRKQTEETKSLPQSQHNALDQQLTAANRELTATRQELSVANEQIATTTEQLRTANEAFAQAQRKLNAANEELVQIVLQRTQEWQAITDALPGVVAQIDQTERYRFANRTYTDWIGLSSEQMLGCPLREVLPREVYDRASPYITKALQGIASKFENSFLDPQGERKWILSQYIPRKERGQPSGFFVLAMDITEQKRAELALQAKNQELQEKNFELDQFVYKTSHDLRAPLTTILGLVDIIRQEEDQATKAHYLALVENRVQKLDRFIRSMLDYSRNTRTATALEKIDFGALIAECLEGLEYMKHFPRLQVEIEAGRGAFYSDVFRLRIIFSNLISNAVKYQDFAKAESRLRIRIAVTNKQATIELADNGVGIEQAYQEKIFDMFFRAAEQSDGSGLGLYIVKQAVGVLKGRIQVDSTFGTGTRFTITLPNNAGAVS